MPEEEGNKNDSSLRNVLAEGILKTLPMICGHLRDRIGLQVQRGDRIKLRLFSKYSLSARFQFLNEIVLSVRGKK